MIFQQAVRTLKNEVQKQPVQQPHLVRPNENEEGKMKSDVIPPSEKQNNQIAKQSQKIKKSDGKWAHDKFKQKNVEQQNERKNNKVVVVQGQGKKNDDTKVKSDIVILKRK